MLFKVQTHNALIISLFDATATLKRPPTPPPPPAPKTPARKRKRALLPYQGPNVPEDARSIRSMRMKRWALSMGRRERERIKALQPPSPPSEYQRPRRETDEIARERGIELLPERGGMSRIFCHHTRQSFQIRLAAGFLSTCMLARVHRPSNTLQIGLT